MRKFSSILFLAVLAALTGRSETPLTIAPADAVIVASNAPLHKVAEELRLHLKLITGVEVPIVSAAPAGSYAFCFDPTLPVADNPESCTWRCSDRKTVFAGHAAFAVADFLESGLGIRWPESDVVIYDECPEIRPCARAGAWAPEVKIRCMRHSRTADPGNAVFARRLRAGRHDAPVYGHAFTDFWKRYGRDHRDYFAMRTDGLRGPVNAKPDELLGNVAVYAANTRNTLAMCCTSTGLVAQIVANWRGAGCPAYINLCENDVPGQNSCHCPSCEALTVRPPNANPKWETHYADRYVHFANQVLASARPHRADVRVCYYAYNATQDAPSRERPDAASVIGLVPTIFSRSSVAAYVDAWRTMGARNFFYRPNRHHYYTCPYLPLGAERHFFDIFSIVRRAGGIGFDYDAPGAPTGSFEWLDRYVLLHAMQDPAKSYDYWEDHYCQAYGAAKEDVKAYFRHWREEVWEKRLEPDLERLTARGKWFNFGRGLVWELKTYYSEADFAAAGRHLDAAATRPLNAPRQAQLARLRRAHEHAKLFFAAVAHKSPANAQALVDFRAANGYPRQTWSEGYFGDITGVGKLPQGD